MKSVSNKALIIMMIISVICMTLSVTVNVTDACRLQSVSLDDEQIEQWQGKFAGLGDGAIIAQRIDTLAANLIKEKSVHKVEVSLSFPSEIKIRTNVYETICMILSPVTGRIHGLDIMSRLVPLSEINVEHDQPIISGVDCGRMYKRPKDSRVRTVVEQLLMLRTDKPDLFYMIDGISLSHNRYVDVSISGLKFRIRSTSEELYRDMNRLIEFISGFSSDLDNTKIIDMRFANMIIKKPRN